MYQFPRGTMKKIDESDYLPQYAHFEEVLILMMALTRLRFFIQFFTKWVPRPEEITRTMATAAIDRSLRRMGTDSLDLLQFHW